MKKFAAFLLAMAMVLSLTACGGKKEESKPADSSTPAEAGLTYETAEDLLSCSWDEIEAAAKEEGELTFAIWNDEAQYNQLCELFTERYGIKVNILAGDKGVVMDKVLMELKGDKGSIDTMYLSGETVNGLLSAGALTPGILNIMEQKDKLVPGLSARKEGVDNSAGYWVPVYTNPCGWLYNADELTEDELPQTMDDLTKFIEENPGRFGMCIPENGGTGQAVMESIIANLTGGLDQYLLAENNECDPALLEKWDAVWEWFDAHKDQIAFTTSNGDGTTRLNSGEVWLVASWNASIFSNIQSGNLTINHGFYVPEMGLCYSGEVMSIVKNAPHPAAALLFINWMTSDEAQNALAEQMNQMTARVDLKQDICYLDDTSRANNVDWMAACYKAQYIKDFTTNVLQ